MHTSFKSRTVTTIFELNQYIPKKKYVDFRIRVKNVYQMIR